MVYIPRRLARWPSETNVLVCTCGYSVLRLWHDALQPWKSLFRSESITDPVVMPFTSATQAVHLTCIWDATSGNWQVTCPFSSCSGETIRQTVTRRGTCMRLPRGTCCCCIFLPINIATPSRRKCTNYLITLLYKSKPLKGRVFHYKISQLLTIWILWW